MNSMKWIFGFWAVVCLMVLATVALAETEADRLCEQGNKLFKTRRFQEALTFYQEALDKELEHCGAMYGCGRSLLRLGQYTRARKMLEDLVALCPRDRRGQLLLGYVQLNFGDPREAAHTFSGLIDANPRDVAALVGLGKAEYAAGNRFTGEQYLRKAIALKPDSERLRQLVRGIRVSNRGHLARERKEKRRRILHGINRTLKRAERDRQVGQTYFPSTAPGPIYVPPTAPYFPTAGPELTLEDIARKLDDLQSEIEGLRNDLDTDDLQREMDDLRNQIEW